MKTSVLSLAFVTGAALCALAPESARAAQCGAEYAAMEHAADNALAACADGNSLATCNYFAGLFEGRAQAYEDCMRRDTSGPY